MQRRGNKGAFGKGNDQGFSMDQLRRERAKREQRQREFDAKVQAIIDRIDGGEDVTLDWTPPNYSEFVEYNEPWDWDGEVQAHERYAKVCKAVLERVKSNDAYFVLRPKYVQGVERTWLRVFHRTECSAARIARRLNEFKATQLAKQGGVAKAA